MIYGDIHKAKMRFIGTIAIAILLTLTEIECTNSRRKHDNLPMGYDMYETQNTIRNMQGEVRT